jgi:hypothetical protein
VALGVIFRNLLVSLVVLGLVVATVGMAIGRFYRVVPVVKGGLETLPIAPFAPSGATAPPYPGVSWPVRLGLAIVAGLAVELYGVELFSTAVRGGRPLPVGRLAIAATCGAIIVGAVGIVVPALVWFSSWVTYEIGFTSRPGVAVASLSAIVSFIGAVAATLWRNKQRVGTLFGSGTRAVKSVLPNSMVQILIIWIALLVLILAAFLSAGWVATSGLDNSWWALAVIVPLTVLAAGLDQTSMSLHHFYRRRLASAFAVRRRTVGGVATADPYDYSELTSLYRYAEQRDDFPRVTFAAAANLTGRDRTPTGRRSVSYALGAEYVGGPQVGWIRTDYLQALSSHAVGHDLTVEAAVAISGAAFASAMGGQTRLYELFLSLVNLRLGAWLPNPYFVALKAARPCDWTVPGLPRLRRLDYFGREILGIHRSTSRMLLCSDGGHYDSLGLVELLRRQCSYIYCFDASGASSPLAEAITLARKELGVEIVLNDPYTLVAGGATAIDPQGRLASLNGRLLARAVTTATIRYPERDDTKPADGLLIFAQASLTPDIAYDLLQFTQSDPGFPNDGTADQWFDASRFDAYHRLGLYLGREVARTRDELVWLNPRDGGRANARGDRRDAYARPREPLADTHRRRVREPKEVTRATPVAQPPHRRARWWGGGSVAIPGSDGPWKVFVSHTSELREYPKDGSYVAAVEAAITMAGHVISDMEYFPARDAVPADVCVEKVGECDVYVGVLGQHYGSPVRDRPDVSYTELEFDAATAAGIPRLMFTLDTDADDVKIPVKAVQDREYGARQSAFRDRVRDEGLVTASFRNPDDLGRRVGDALRELADRKRHLDADLTREKQPAEPRPVAGGATVEEFTPAPNYAHLLAIPASELEISPVEPSAPMALLSYSRFDDKQYSRLLTSIRRYIEGAVQGVTGRPFQVFQDVEDIKLGDDWHATLAEAISKADILIPIITPSFLESKWCREEVERFVQKEADRSSFDIVVPLYFIESRAFEEDPGGDSREVAELLRRRQWLDIRDLRLEQSANRRVKERLEPLVQRLKDIVNR